MTKSIEEALRVLEVRLEALDKQCAALTLQMQRQNEASAAINETKRQLAAGAMEAVSLTSRWNRPYDFAHYLIQQNEECLQKRMAALDALREAAKALADKPLAPVPETGQQTAKPCRTELSPEIELRMLAWLLLRPSSLLYPDKATTDDCPDMPDEVKARLLKRLATGPGEYAMRYLAACRVQQLLRDIDTSPHQAKQVSP